MTVLSAHELVKTVDCQAPGCPREAEHGAELCATHAHLPIAPAKPQTAGVWCETCKESSMPNYRGECSWCGSQIVDPPTSLPVPRPQPEAAETGVVTISQPVAAPTEEVAVARQWTRELIIDAIRRWALEHGEPPKATDWQRGANEERPGYATVIKFCGTWPDAMPAAGFEPRTTGWPKRPAAKPPRSSSAVEPKGREAHTDALPASPLAAPTADGAVRSDSPSPAMAAEARSTHDENLDAWLATLELTPPRLYAEEERLRALIAVLEFRAQFVKQVAGSLENLRGVV